MIAERHYALLQIAQRISHVGSWELRITDKTLTWSEEMYRIFGSAPGASPLSIDDFFSAVHPDDVESLRSAHQQMLSQRSSLEIVYRIVRPDGDVRHVHSRVEYHADDTGIPMLIGTVHDVTEQMLNEQKLQRSERLLRFASATVRMGTWEIEFPQDRIVWSDEVCDIHEVARGTTPTVTGALNFYPPQSRPMMEHAFTECCSHGTAFDLEVQIRSANARELWVRVIGQPALGEDGAIRGVYGACQDITAIKQSQQDALRVAARLTRTLESITEAFFTLDRHWHFSYVNAEAERLLERSRSELLGKYIWSEFKQAVGSASYHQYRRARADNVTVAFEQFYPPLGRWFDIRAFPSEDGLAVYFSDVTTRRGAEVALRVSQERFNIVAKATADTIWDWDLKADTIWWSESISTVFGFNPNDLEPGSTSWTRYIHAGDRERVMCGIHAVIDSEQDKWTDQYRFTRSDGDYAYVLDRGYVIRSDDGRAIRMVGSMTDITAQKQAEVSLARLNRALLLRGACDRIINSIADEKELLHSVCRVALSIGAYRCAWIGYAQDAAGSSFRVEAYAAEDPALACADVLGLGKAGDEVLELGAAEGVLDSGMPLAIDNLALASHTAPWLRAAKKHGMHGLIGLPLRHRECLFGVMVLYVQDMQMPSAEEIKLLQEMAVNLAHGIQNLRDREENRLIQSAVSKVAASFSVSAGPWFFERLVINMTEAVGSQAGFVARLLPGEPLTARTVAVVTDREVGLNFDYVIEETPCENVLRTGACVIPDNFAAQFCSPVYALPGTQAYVGRRLDDSAGNPLGLLFVLFDAPIKRVDLVSSTIQIFASRIAAELERLDADARMREQAELLDKAKDAIVVKGLDHRVRFWNKGAERLYKWTAEEALGQSVEELLFEDPAQLRHATELLLQYGRWSGETTERCKDGKRLTIENHWTLVSDERGVPQSIFAIKTDITQRKADEDEIHQLAFYDPLTGLPNRRLLIERLNARLSAAPAGINGALLFVDLDNFKILNDSFGHDQGDELLRQVGQRIRTRVREHDTVARLGGDEFVIILDRLAPASSAAAAQATRVAEKILALFNHPFELTQAEVYSTPSIGVALFDRQGSANELLKLADTAMYQAKAAGRNTMRFFDPKMQAVVAARMAMEADLRQALQRDELLLHFQPQVDVTGRITGAEALARWMHPSRGMISPSEFISLAEETGLILPLGEWVLRTACLQLAAWAEDPLLGKLSLAVNVSARQFKHPSFIERVLAIFAETRSDPSRLKLELTESLLLDNVEDTIEKMTILKASGVGFSLDDFGTGYSSLMYLKRLPLDQLKIDQSFVRDVLLDPNDASIVRTIVALGQSLGLSVIAEGVETGEQRDFLARHDCTAYQGYFFSKPLPIAEFDAFVLARAN